MSIRNTTIALAALAMLAGTALTSTSASALGGHGFGGHMGHGPVVGGGRFHFDHRFPIWDRYHFQHRFPIWGYRNWPRWRFGYYRFWRFPRPVVIGGTAGVVTTTAASARASAPAARQTSCLTKDYAPDGTVIFKDLCTNEEGVGAPQGAPPQGPAR